MAATVLWSNRVFAEQCLLLSALSLSHELYRTQSAFLAVAALMAIAGGLQLSLMSGQEWTLIRRRSLYQARRLSRSALGCAAEALVSRPRKGRSSPSSVTGMAAPTPPLVRCSYSSPSCSDLTAYLRDFHQAWDCGAQEEEDDNDGHVKDE